MKHLMVFEQFVEEKNTMEVELKDEMRINDIIRKSGGDKSKAEALAKTMASRITDRYKAIRREKAARSLGHPELAQIFNDRMKEL
jgi:Spy/CpxP family protein refolding chaperone